MNFLGFLSRYAAVEIPMLQRDYAQGRREVGSEEMNSKGRNFLTYLFDTLTARKSTGESQYLSLDLIYGSTEARDSLADGVLTFIPLDGQQRLTTLWLLHWWVAATTTGGDDMKYLMTQLAKFSYATRSTARQFCRQLCEPSFYDQFAQRAVSGKPSAYISTRIWFTRDYGYDSTVSGMLVMLDAIAEHQQNQPLTLADLCAIHFQILDLGVYDLTDELYIKLNGRGKPLSSVENLKADLINYLRAHNYDFTRDDSCDRKLDHSWAELAWGRVGAAEREEAYSGFDARYLRLFKHYFYGLWVSQDNSVGSTTPEELTRDFTELDYRGFAPYARLLDSDPDRLGKMVRFFDFLADPTNLPYSRLLRAPWVVDWGAQEEDHLPQYPYLLDESELGMRDRLALYALMLYVDHTPDEALSLEKYTQWMRLVWNLIADPQLRSYQAQKRYLRLLAELAQYTSDIEAHLMTAPEITNARLQREQEKIRYLHQHPQRRAALLRLEAHLCLQGQVGFILECNADDATFAWLSQLAGEVIRADCDWMAECFWPAVIARLDEPLFDLPYPGNFDYLAHREHGSRIDWRLQDLLNRGHIAKAFRELLQLSLLQSTGASVLADFEAVCRAVCDSYVLNETIPWHYPLVKYDLLKRCRWGRFYQRREMGFWLQLSWRVTVNPWRGYYVLSGCGEARPLLLVLGGGVAAEPQ